MKEFDQGLRVVNRGMQELARVLPSPVEVYSHKRGSVIAVNDPVWIQDRNNFENEVLTELHCCRIIRNNELYTSLQHILGVGLPRMNP